jgi:hypothetical protein
MSCGQGDEVHGEVHTDDASGGVVALLYRAGSLTARTLAADEFLTITDIQVVSAPGGDIMAFLGADGTPGAGEYVLRGTVAATGGIAKSFIVTPRTGAAGHNLYIKGPAGDMDVTFTGRITRA